MNDADSGWGDLPDRLEIVWGPDYRGRYDFHVFEGNGRRDCFAVLPATFPLPIIDKRAEVAAFDLEEGFKRIGMSISSRREPGDVTAGGY